MIDPVHLLNYVIRPVLKDLGLHSVSAEKLLLGTACQESQCGRWLRQIGEGPAVSIYQIEPRSHDDVWINFLANRPELTERVRLTMITPSKPQAWEMVGNIFYATAMCRIFYLRVPEPIPESLPEQATYWKRYYNTELGAGTAQEYMNAWYRFVPRDI